METNTLVSQLFSKQKTKQIQKLYLEDVSSRHIIRDTIAKELFSSEKIITTNNLVDVLGLILLNNSFGADDNESFQVALLVARGLKFIDPLPSLLDKPDLDFITKSLISLSWFRKKLEYRTRYYAAPPPEYYEGLAKQLLIIYEYPLISRDFSAWTATLSEIFV